MNAIVTVPSFAALVRAELATQKALHAECDAQFRHHDAKASECRSARLSATLRIEALEKAIKAYPLYAAAIDAPLAKIEHNLELPETASKVAPKADQNKEASHEVEHPKPSSSTDTEQPSGAEAGSDVGTVAPQTKRDQILDLWSTTSLSYTEIAEKVGTTKESVNAEIGKARLRRDTRAMKASERPGLQESRGAAGAPKIRAPKSAAAKKAPPAKPEDVSPVAKAPTATAELIKQPFLERMNVQSPAVIARDEIGVFMTINATDMVVTGLRGEMETSRLVVNTLARMTSGGLFDHKTLAQAGRWEDAETFRLSIPQIKLKLARIGVDFVEVPKAGCRIRRMMP